MEARRFVGLVALVAASACNPFHRSHAVQIESGAAPIGNRWNATLATPAGLTGALQLHGSAWMAASGDHTTAYVAITNAAPGGMHPWHVHEGQCGSNGRIVGPPTAYPPLKVSDDGTASAQADLPMPLPTSGSYYVNVHASSDNMGTIIACGNLAPPSK